MSENLNNDQIISADFEVSTELNVQLGSVYQGSSVDSLSELSDVAIDISTLTNGNSLIYNSTSGKWTNGEIAPGADDLSELGDVSITTPSNDQILRYNSTSGKWVNSAESAGPSDLNGLNDVSITSPSADQILKYDSISEKWINSEVTPSASDLSDLGDVAISSPSNDQILKYNSTSGKWENGTGGGGASALSDLSDVNIDSAADKEYLTYNNSAHKWENMSINDILSSKNQASTCVFYSPVKANLLDCVLYITPNQTFGEGVPSPTNYRGFDWYTQTTITNTNNYYNYFNGLFRQSRYDGSCWYIELNQLNWYYNEDYGVFTATLYDNAPKSHFQSICSRDYNYAGPIENHESANMTYGYRGSNSDAFWLRNDSYTDAEELKASLAGIYIIYESYYNSEPAMVEVFNNLVSIFGITGWAHQVSWTDLDFRVYGAEYYPISGALYTTWVCERITPETTGYSFEDGYIVYDMSGWDNPPKVSASALCTNFRFEADTYTPAEDYFSIKDNKLILNISSIGDTEADWVEWLTQKDYFEVTYEVATPTYTYRSPFIIPNFKYMNFLSHSSVGTTKVQYYGGDATTYINLTNTVINNAELDDLKDVDISNVQDSQILKYNSTSGKWENTTESSIMPDLGDLSDVTLTTPTNGQTLIYNSANSKWVNGNTGGSSHIYSTTEQIVGTWIDGSTVYEKVCTGTTNGETAQVLVSGVSKIVSMTGHAGPYALPALNIDNNRKYILVQVGGSSGTDARLYTSGSNYVGLTYEVVLRYTKSSS